MNQFFRALVLTGTLLLCIAGTYAQQGGQTITGIIKDAAGNPLAGAIIKNRTSGGGSSANEQGVFTIVVNSVPVKLEFSHIGYRSTTRTFTAAGTTGTIILDETGITGTEVVVAASRISESILRAPVSVEKVTAKSFRESAAAGFWDALNNVKGVDLGTQSIGFKSVNIRGYGANNNTRVVQLIDGMDTRSPGLGFPLGNVVGISELDVDNVEIIPGAASALYGPDALNGVVATTSKDPFLYQGLSVQLRNGLNHVSSKDFSNPKYLADYALRYAWAGKRFAFKINGSYFRGTDWVADDYSDRLNRGRTNGLNYVPNNDRNSNFLYDGVNLYGDEYTGAITIGEGALAGQKITRTGYREQDLRDNTAYSYKVSGEVRYKLTDDIQAIATGYWGNGNAVQTPADRNYFPDIKRFQGKLELKGSDFFVRAWKTWQTTDGAYGTIRLANALNALGSSNTQWAADFAAAYDGSVSDVTSGSAAAARAYADRTRLLPGTAAFNRAKDSLTSRLFTQGGVGVQDNSSLLQYEGNYNFTRLLNTVTNDANIELLIGGSFREYFLKSGGTYFPLKNAAGDEYTVKEYGSYLQLSRAFHVGNVQIKPTFGGRYDKNEYFKGGFTPRGSLAVGVGSHNFRFSYQQAFRNPTPTQLFAYTAGGGELGGGSAAINAANAVNNPLYFGSSVNAYRQTGNAGSLVAYNPSSFTTEKIKSWEVGYKTLIAGKVYVDAYYYSSVYTDFIAAQQVYQSAPADGAATTANLLNDATSTIYQLNMNSKDKVYARGWGIGAEYSFYQHFKISANVANNEGLKADPNDGNKKKLMSDPAIAAAGRNFFNTPTYRYNVTISNPRLTSRLGFSATWRWQDRTWWEQGFGDAWIPSFGTVDAQLTYQVYPDHFSIKAGASNLLNKRYIQGYALPSVGGLYYLTFSFDDLLHWKRAKG